MDTTNETLLRKFQRLEWLLRRLHLRGFHERGPMASPRRGQGRILSLLKIKNEISQKDLAAILDIRPQSLGELLAKLEKAGFIERTPSEQDKRIMEIRLTESGKAASEEAPETEEIGSVFDCLDDAERTAFAGYLERLIERTQEMSGLENGDRGDEFDRIREFMAGFGPGFGPGGMRGGPGRHGGSGGSGHGPGRRGGPGGGSGCMGYGGGGRRGAPQGYGSGRQVRGGAMGYGPGPEYGLHDGSGLGRGGYCLRGFGYGVGNPEN